MHEKEENIKIKSRFALIILGLEIYGIKGEVNHLFTYSIDWGWSLVLEGMKSFCIKNRPYKCLVNSYVIFYKQGTYLIKN